MHGNDTSRGTLTRCEVAIPGYVSGGRFADTTWSLEDTDMMQFLDVLLWDPVISRNIPIQDGYVEVPNLEKPVLELAYAQLGMKQNILESTADPLEALYVHKVTTCRFSMCLWEYNVSIANTSVVTTAKVVDEGRFFYADDDESSICWVPQGGSTRIPANTSIPSEDSLYLDATDLRICGVWDLRFTEFLATVEQLYIRAVNDTNSSTWVYYGAQEMANPGFWRVRAIGFENFMTRLATSLTHTLMDDSNYTIKGTVSEPRAFVKVQWLWLILPALLVLGGNIFFALTVFTSRKEKVLPWKSSSLALFYHGLENVDHDDELYTTAKRMEEMAKTVDLRLEPSDEDGRLVLQKQ
ncbi:hypothetical protein BJY04DRAFT_181612 [Aspergillus karnatakaensis]|uniref:uncharacterized protein n=1 Tax=Aspergillus karnatakaensis TaxID=1810916 RepID=UPI003CCCD91F